METSKTRPIIDLKELEWELRTNDYEEYEIEAIMERAREINADESHAAQKLNEMVYQTKWDLD